MSIFIETLVYLCTDTGLEIDQFFLRLIAVDWDEDDIDRHKLSSIESGQSSGD